MIKIYLFQQQLVLLEPVNNYLNEKTQYTTNLYIQRNVKGLTLRKIKNVDEKGQVLQGPESDHPHHSVNEGIVQDLQVTLDIEIIIIQDINEISIDIVINIIINIRK